MGKKPTPESRPPRVETDERGRSVWSEPVGTDTFDLVTTQELRGILESSDDQRVQEIETVAAAAGTDEGVLARHSETGMFQIIGETELQAILSRNQIPESAPAQDASASAAGDVDDDEKLSLVSTQALRKMLSSEAPSAGGEPELDIEPSGGFDPYNSS